MIIISTQELNKSTGEFENISDAVIDDTIEGYINFTKTHKQGIIYVDTLIDKKHFQRLIIDNLQNRQFLITVDQFL